MHFRNLEVYKAAVRVLYLAAQVCADMAVNRHGELRDQLRRASLSICLNIAESSGKTKIADQQRFFAIARGSAMECAALVDACRVFEAAQSQLLDDLDAGLLPVVRMLSRLAR